MTTRRIYAIVDSKAGDIVGTLLLARVNAPAVRIFTDLVKDKNNDIGMHPEDYTLVQLGILNDDLTLTPENMDIVSGTTVKTLLDGAETQETGNVKIPR